MNSEVTIAIISGLCVAIPTLVATLVTNAKNNALQDDRIANVNNYINNLTEKVEKHNNFGLKIVAIETKLDSIESRLANIEKR